MFSRFYPGSNKSQHVPENSQPVSEKQQFIDEYTKGLPLIDTNKFENVLRVEHICIAVDYNKQDDIKWYLGELVKSDDDGKFRFTLIETNKENGKCGRKDDVYDIPYDIPEKFCFDTLAENDQTKQGELFRRDTIPKHIKLFLKQKKFVTSRTITTYPISNTVTNQTAGKRKTHKKKRTLSRRQKKQRRTRRQR